MYWGERGRESHKERERERERERKRGTEREVMYVNETVNHILSTLIEREEGGGFGIAVNKSNHLTACCSLL